MENITYYFIISVVTIIFVLLLRPLYLWYWRINDITNNQEKTNKLLNQLVELMGGQAVDDPNFSSEKIILNDGQKIFYIIFSLIILWFFFGGGLELFI